MSVRQTYSRLFLLIPCILWFAVRVNAQGNIPRETLRFVAAGDAYYQEEQYSKAATFYKSALSLDSSHVYARYHLAECLRKTLDYGPALSHYQQVVEGGAGTYPGALFFYPLMQKLEGKFASAHANFTIFIAYAEKHPFENSDKLAQRAKIERDGCQYAMAQLAGTSGDYRIEHPGAPLNSRFNDYAPWILSNDSSLTFTSGRPSVTGKLENNRYGEYFSDNFRYFRDSTGWHPLKDTDNFDVTNSPFIEGTGSFNRDRTKFYFTGCYAETGCRIYVSVRKKGKWTQPQLLNKNINAEGTDAKQPSLSPGADTLFFVSGRPGGFGGNDIWMSISDSTVESWGPAVNLGRKINTPFDEISPFLYREKDLLFFASDGHRGFGGLDIFVSSGKTFQQATVHNMGLPFNSSGNDSYLVTGQTTGYLASNRAGSLGGFDIYRFGMGAARAMVNEITNEGSGGRMLYSRVRSLSGSDILVMRDEDKFFYQNLPPAEKERIDRIIAAKLAVLNGYGEKLLSTTDQEYFRELGAGHRASITRIAHLLYESKRQNAKQLIKPSGLPQRNNGIFALDRPLLAYADLPEGVIPGGGESAGGSINAPGVTAERSKNSREQFPETVASAHNEPVKNKDKTAEAGISRFENIYFDLDQVALRPEARRVLDGIITYYHQNPGMQLTLSVYSDSTGTKAYNLRLSERRGAAALAYLVAGGMPPEIVKIAVWGQQNPAAPNDTPAGRQVNRRITFTVTGASVPYRSEVATYFTKRAMTLNALAEATGNTVEALRQYNGLAGQQDIPAYAPVRIRMVYTAGEMEDFLLKAPIH